jgi:hypothetical protein
MNPTPSDIDILRAKLVALLELWPPAWVFQHRHLDGMVQHLAASAILALGHLEAQMPAANRAYAASRQLTLACIRSRADALCEIVAAGEFDADRWDSAMSLQRALLEDANAMLPVNPVAAQP